jgi:hypothetical protein
MPSKQQIDERQNETQSQRTVLYWPHSRNWLHMLRWAEKTLRAGGNTPARNARQAHPLAVQASLFLLCVTRKETLTRRREGSCCACVFWRPAVSS